MASPSAAANSFPDAAYRVAVVGGTGYAGAEVVRLLLDHPQFEVAVVTSGRSAGIPLHQECPWLNTDLVLSEYAPDTWTGIDAVVLAQEAGFAAEHAAELIPHYRVIDLSADFRLRDPELYRQYYGKSPAPNLGAVYGLPELVDRDEIRNARLVANPGCHVTAALLALMPLVSLDLLTGTPIVDTKTGVSGAGRGRKETEYLFSEIAEDIRPYAVTGHRHIPEIEQMVGRPIRFTPHLIPVTRGLLGTIYAPVRAADFDAIYREFYAGEPFVRVIEGLPQTKAVRGSNRADLAVRFDERTEMLTIMVAIDNLTKGAGGVAVQNLNLMFGLPETAGLSAGGLWP